MNFTILVDNNELMIKLFRKIRYDLMEKNNTVKYFKYAIGEIILVVIGILIALSINNWNQNQIQNRKSKVYLEQFKTDIDNDLKALSEKIATNSKVMGKIDTISMTLVLKANLTSDELSNFIKLNESLVYESYFVPERSTIDQLVGSSQGDFIKNKELRSLLFQYYSTNQRNEKNQEVSTQLYQHHYITQHITNTILMSAENFNRQGAGNLNRPSIDYPNLSLNTDYMASLILKKRITFTQNVNYKRIKSMAEKVAQMLKDELYEIEN